jgi:hypothetical protein
VKRDLGLFTPFGFHPYGGAVFEERSPQGLGAFHDFLHHYRFLESVAEAYTTRPNKEKTSKVLYSIFESVANGQCE